MYKLYFFILIGILSTACNKEGKDHPCYNSAIVHDRPCPSDCPGFKGCDGKNYCNSCEAARHGIGPK